MPLRNTLKILALVAIAFKVQVATQDLLTAYKFAEIDERIINGYPASPGEAPYLAQIVKGPNGVSDYLFPGFLIHPNWIITYAFVSNYGNLTIRFASLRVNDYEPNRLEYYVPQKSVTVHPLWDGYIKNAMALIRMPYPVPVSPAREVPSLIAIARIPRSNEIRNNLFGTIGKLCGWGFTVMFSRNVSDVLRCKKTNPVIQNFPTCNKTFYPYVTDSTFCTAAPDFNAPNVGCKGDGGAPFVVAEGSTSKALGMFNWIYPSCGYGPEGYLKMASYYEWIRNVTKINI